MLQQRVHTRKLLLSLLLCTHGIHGLSETAGESDVATDNSTMAQMSAENDTLVVIFILRQLNSKLGIERRNLQQVVIASATILFIMAVIVFVLLLHRCYALLVHDDYQNIRRFQLPMPMHPNNSAESVVLARRVNRGRRTNKGKSSKLSNGELLNAQSSRPFLCSSAAMSVNTSLRNLKNGGSEGVVQNPSSPPSQQQTQRSFHSLFAGNEMTGNLQQYCWRQADLSNVLNDDASFICENPETSAQSEEHMGQDFRTAVARPVYHSMDLAVD